MAMRILDVGQCGFDGPRMTELLHAELGAKVDQADTAEEASHKASSHPYDIILVNRVLAHDGSSGLALIGQLTRSGIKAPIMLVSDLEDAQKQAIALGAVRGFGKAVLEDPKTLDLIRGAADAKSSSK